MEPYVTTDTLEASTRRWMERIAPFNEPRMEFSPGSAALMVVDMQKFFLDPASPTFTCGGIAIIPTIQSLLAAFRAAKRPVIYTRHVHHPDERVRQELADDELPSRQRRHIELLERADFLLAHDRHR